MLPSTPSTALVQKGATVCPDRPQDSRKLPTAMGAVIHQMGYPKKITS